ncbi:MAG TPA: pitrilysin family protein [Ignavibacteriaceae bacterium]|nr:pitrilysin family protein [Ignavibacteriaceae bacterium]
MNLLDIKYEKYKLQNGLEVILHSIKNIPVVASNIWYKVGSANEKRGKTGLAHFFEHMMFQGSQNVAKEMHFRFIQEAGGSLNGSTGFDRTNYYEKVPSNFLELILWLESDRMGYLLPSLNKEKLENQISVVKNERLERYDNQPYGLAWEKIIASLYPDEHPYSWPTIGFLNDISGYTLEDVINFFKKYYSPSNASLVLSGHFDPERGKELIEKYFSGLPSQNSLQNLSPIKTELSKNKLIHYEDNVNLGRIYLAWHSEKAFGKDDACLDILADILSGSKNSRLYKSLVYDNELAQDVSAFQYSGKLTGNFMIIATARPGISLKMLKDKIFEILNDLGKQGVSERELLRSKNGIKSNFIYSLQNVDSLADQLNFYNFYLDEPNSFNYDLKRYEEVNGKMLSAVTEKYLGRPYIELHILPKKVKT